MKPKRTIGSTSFLFPLISLLWTLVSTQHAAAQEVAARPHAEELAPLLSHYGVMQGANERVFYSVDNDQYRDIANRLSKQAASSDLREVAQNCIVIAAKLDKSHAVYDELTKDRPGPGKNIVQMMSWVMDQSAKGAFQWETTTVRQEHGWTITERGVKDHTLEAAAFYGSIGMLMNREAERKHQLAVFKLRQAAARELMKIEDDVEQLRLKAAAKLTEKGFAPFAGAIQAEPRLEVKLGREEFESSFIDKFIDEKQRLAAAAEREKERMERLKRGEPDIPSAPTRPNLSLRNPGATLHRVGLTIDYYHYRLPEAAIGRQFFWLPEWKTNEVFSITEALRLNLENRAMAGLRDDVNGANNLFGHQVFPQFSGLVRLKYSLLSDELRQDNVVIDFTDNRALIRDTLLHNSEDLATKLLSAMSSGGAWSKLTVADKNLRTQLATQTIKEFAASASANASDGWEGEARAKALLKDHKAVTKQVEAVRSDILGACQAGSVYRGTRSSRMSEFTRSSGTYELEFTSAKSAQRIEVTITRTGNDPIDPPIQRYIGKVVPSRERGADLVLSLSPVPDSEATRKSTAPLRKEPGAKPAAGKAAPAGTAASTPPQQYGSSRPPLVAAMPWELTWKKDRWVCTADQTEFAFVTRKPAEEIGKPSQPQFDQKFASDSNNGPASFAPNATWEGTRVFTDDKGTVLSQQKLKFVIRDYPGVIANGSPITELIRFGEFFVDDKPVGASTRIEIYKPRAGVVRVRLSASSQPLRSKTPGQQVDSLEGELKNGVLGGAVQRFNGPMNIPNHYAWEMKLKK